MEFTEVVRRRRMVRNYSPEPVDAEVLRRILGNALHAPSAGFSQGWAFLVLDGPDEVQRYWRATAGDRVERPGAWLAGMMTAPVVVVAWSSKQVYLDRYAEPDKGWTDRSEDRWAVPYWDVDTGMAALLVLLGAVDEGLGGCFFGVPPARVDDLRREFDVPDSHRPVGALTLGHRVADPGPRGSTARGRRPFDEVVHRGGWHGDWGPTP
jgi:nitroreductase